MLLAGCDTGQHWKKQPAFKVDAAGFGTLAKNVANREIFVHKKEIPLESGYPYSWKIHFSRAPEMVTWTEEFILPVITHKTRLKERKFFLDGFRSGDFTVLVTSKVLNEGVDVPEASVGIVVSGSGAVREHVQRLGRILRHQPGKRACLYELVSEGTSEKYVNQRRRKHHAYEGTPQV